MAEEISPTAEDKSEDYEEITRLVLEALQQQQEAVERNFTFSQRAIAKRTAHRIQRIFKDYPSKEPHGH
jgi:hypothetical protein